MRLHQRVGRFAVAGLLLLLANGCGRSEEQPAASPPDLDRIELEESPDTATTGEPEATPAEQCIEMATREDWSAALDPCTRAARNHPDDEAIQRALERAMSASDEAIE